MQDPGRKIPAHLDNPFDNVFIAIANTIQPAFHTLGFTANGITILSGIFSLAAVYCLWRGWYGWCALMYLVGYFFDVMDGYYARTYKMVSNYGDMLDHVKDWIAHVLFYVILLMSPRIAIVWKVWFIGIAIVFAVTTSVQMGCQEVYYSKKKQTNESPTLSVLQKLCTKDEEEKLMMLRWVGLGTYNVLIVISLILMYVLANSNVILSKPVKKRKN